jgi:Lysine methyltransferase
VAHQLQEASVLHNDDRGNNDSNVVDDTNAATSSSSASYVYLTDGDTDALVQLRHNVRHNQRSDRIHCQQLLWGTVSATAFAQTYGTVDVLLASDIVYVSIYFILKTTSNDERRGVCRPTRETHNGPFVGPWFSRCGWFDYVPAPPSHVSLNLSHARHHHSLPYSFFTPFSSRFLLLCHCCGKRSEYCSRNKTGSSFLPLMPDVMSPSRLTTYSKKRRRRGFATN